MKKDSENFRIRKKTHDNDSAHWIQRSRCGMKKIIFALLLVFILNDAVFASISAKSIGENVLNNILMNVINNALKKNGMGDLISGGAESSDEGTKTSADKKISRKSDSKVTELSAEQYQSFSEICLAGSLEEFRKKIEYENISHDAKYTKEDGTVITLLEIAKTSPNPELAEFLEPAKSEEE